MKTKSILAFLFFIYLSGNLFSQSWLWAKSGYGSGGDEGNSVCADAGGNVFITGQFQSPTITFGSTILTNSGMNDVFIAKYDSSGNVLWAKSVGGIGDDKAYSVSTDAIGNVFVIGYFASPTITFGSTTLNNSGITKIFIVKYDVNGNVLWAKSAGGTNWDRGYSTFVDAGGNVFVTGMFTSSHISFDSITLSNAGSYDIFIAKYDANGNALWATSAGGGGEDVGYSVSADAAGNVFVTGYFESPTISFGSTVLINTGTYNVFIAKYDVNGNLLWAKRAGGTGDDRGYSVSADTGGNVFVTGYFQSSSITFGSTTLINTGITKHVFIAKYDASGNGLWAKSAGGTNDNQGYSVSADAEGNVFVTGGFYLSVTFGSITLTPLASSTDPMFIVRYDPNGDVLCASALASGGDDNNGVSAGKSGVAYIGGDFQANPLIVGTDTLPYIGQGNNIFLAKYKCNNNVAVHELSNEESISVYPNPANGRFSVSTQTLKQVQGDIVIYNVLGEKIFQSTIFNSQSTVDISSQPNGVYFLQLKTEEGLLVKKITLNK